MEVNFKKPERSPSVCFLIVNWNKRDALKNCLSSIQASLSKVPYEIIVVDNSSTDGSQGMVEQSFPDVRLLRNKENLGFARANNQALRYLKTTDFSADYVIFLNNDTLLVDHSIEKIIEFMETKRNVVASIPAVFLGNTSLQTGIGGFDLSIMSTLFYNFFFCEVFPRTCRGLFFKQSYFFKRKKCFSLDWLSGVCLIVRKSILDETEGFREEYFMYAEDLALCRELRRKGSLVYFPDSRILHLKNSRDKAHWNVAWIESLFRYYRQYQKGSLVAFKLFILKGLFLAGFLLRAAGYNVLSLCSREKYVLKRSELAYYARYVLGKLFVKG
jgi:N-acetylglucosaminyl-diphospho-decaprenol L-rhamnosyltransferase